jgi:hypothetical protein
LAASFCTWPAGREAARATVAPSLVKASTPVTLPPRPIENAACPTPCRGAVVTAAVLVFASRAANSDAEPGPIVRITTSRKLADPNSQVTPGVVRGNDFSRATFAYGSNTDVGICAHVFGSAAVVAPPPDELGDDALEVVGALVVDVAVVAGPLEADDPLPLPDEHAPVVTRTATAPPINIARWITT